MRIFRRLLSACLAASLGLPAPAFAGALEDAVARFRAVRDGAVRDVASLERAGAAPAAARAALPPAPVAAAADAFVPLPVPLPHRPAALPPAPDAVPAPEGAVRLTLAEAVGLALEGHYGLRIKERAVELALLDVSDVTRRMLPMFDFALIGTRLNEARSMVFGPTRITLSEDFQKTYKFDLTWPLYLFGKLENAERAAHAGVDARRAERESDAVNAVLQVKQAFYGMLLAERFVKIAEQSLAQIDNHVKTVKSQFEVGMASKFDLLRVEVQRANTKPQLIRAALALKNAKEGFNMLLGRPVGMAVEPVGELAARVEKPSAVETLVAAALAKRQDLIKARKEHEAAAFALEEAKLGRRPTLALSSGYTRVEGAGIPLDKWDESWNANLALQVPIFDARATAVAAGKAAERLKQAAIALEMTENQVRLDVRTAANEMIQAVELVAASEKNIVQAEEALNIANVSYENGLNTNLEVMDAQLALDQARTNHSQAVHDWLVAKAKLDRALGEIPEAR